ncbi:polysaccharide deacetylase family protein [Kocuria sp. TGY1127_2]|uniref:polysaccharide deacetylase family protein n=1 Tax=Kocuria sp. TGY1127_2 TaxID=2711328 RepID=UPI0015C12032|nr:polysaccharide deacetylase family protein [Kocuria sp. TGY1127_2]
MKITRRTAVISSSALVGAALLSACSSQDTEPATDSSTTSAPTSNSPSVTPTQHNITWKDNTEVSHLFFHSLVVDPNRAFDGDDEANGYLDYMVTINEFRKIIQQVYDRNYVLVSPHQLYTTRPGGSVELKPLDLPEGKKPLVLSFDDLSYYEYMDGDGFSDRLIVQDGKVLNEYRDADGNKKIGAYDHLPIVEEFIEEHPDFSHDGAKGVIAITGYNGVLGYRTSDISYKDENKNIEKDKKTAKSVADAIKKNGWEFASHSWGHINFTKSPLSHIQEDNEKWQAEVAPIVGNTDMLIYPFGADICGIEEYGNDKFQYLKGQGFNSYFNVDASTPAWGQAGPNYLREARINVDGISLKHAIKGTSDTLREFFDPNSVIDPARPKSISGASS